MGASDRPQRPFVGASESPSRKGRGGLGKGRKGLLEEKKGPLEGNVMVERGAEHRAAHIYIYIYISLMWRNIGAIGTFR